MISIGDHGEETRRWSAKEVMCVLVGVWDNFTSRFLETWLVLYSTLKIGEHVAR